MNEEPWKVHDTGEHLWGRPHSAATDDPLPCTMPIVPVSPLPTGTCGMVQGLVFLPIRQMGSSAHIYQAVRHETAY